MAWRMANTSELSNSLPTVLKRRVFLKPSKIRRMEKGKKTGIRKVESS